LTASTGPTSSIMTLEASPFYMIVDDSGCNSEI